MIVVFGILIISIFIISGIIVALVLRLSHKKAWYDTVDDRKIHTGDVPRLGGIGFASAFLLAILVITFLLPVLPVHLVPETAVEPFFLFPLIAMILIFIAGIFDDFRPMTPSYKLVIQIIAGILVLIPDYTFHRIFFFEWDLNVLRYPLTLLWIVGLTNAVNLIDGVDGLAGGVSALAALFYALYFAYFANGNSTILICLCLAAALGGFLVFNMPLPKAKIFMGDGGSQFLGFTLALLPLLHKNGAGSGIPLFYAAALLSIPIFDTVAAVWRRVRDRRSISSPDRHHVHHKLINLGLNARGVDGVIYSLQILLGFLVFQSLRSKGGFSLIFLGAAYVAVVGFFIIIHYLNRAVTKKQQAADGNPPSES
jgi:UDP-GlcNAc:undecaprenyl-phosphate GlcNAc-1-phosphate transferase